MERAEILDAIRRTAEDGKPLGVKRFETATGTTPTDWGRFWAKWSEAQREAGFEPNQKIEGYGDAYLFEKMIELTREIGKYPTDRDRRVKAHSDPTFPSHRVFDRLGNRAQFASKLAAFCADKPEYADIAEILAPLVESSPSVTTEPTESTGKATHGFVYLLKGSPGRYKIGHTTGPGRRQYELSAGASTELDAVHKIETDDPLGVEAYWHTRFAAQRTHREWFKLSAADVKAFKRWRKLY
jgi:Meiotically up-regulated gene 113